MKARNQPGGPVRRSVRVLYFGRGAKIQIAVSVIASQKAVSCHEVDNQASRLYINEIKKWEEMKFSSD